MKESLFEVVKHSLEEALGLFDVREGFDERLNIVDLISSNPPAKQTKLACYEFITVSHEASGEYPREEYLYEF